MKYSKKKVRKSFIYSSIKKNIILRSKFNQEAKRLMLKTISCC